jgi:hypothetical protein
MKRAVNAGVYLFWPNRVQTEFHTFSQTGRMPNLLTGLENELIEGNPQEDGRDE